MPQVMVCRRWPLRLQGGEGGYYHYINERAGEVGRNADCIRRLLKDLMLPSDITVVEPFGGVGVFATVIQGVCKPKQHFLFDIDEDCLEQLRTAFANTPGVLVEEGNAEDVIGGIPGDLYVLDFPSPFTVLHHNRWGQQLERLFMTCQPRAVIWMDGASFGMQWHAERYAKAFVRRVKNNEDYARAMSEYVYQSYGYSVRVVTVSRGCFYFAFTPGWQPTFSFYKFTTKGRSLNATTDRPAPPVLQHLSVDPVRVA